MNTKMCAMLLCMLILAGAALAATNAVPTVQVLSAGMRPGTSLMDVVYKITDPDDATVKVRALAFKDGTRSFANVIRPVTFVENTQTNIGDVITTGVNHTLTWDVRADWNIDLANVKFEVLCRDSRDLLPLDWITIPATTNTPAVTISLNVPTHAQVRDAMFWLYADRDPDVEVMDDTRLMGTAASGMFSGQILLDLQYTTSIRDLGVFYLYRRMNFARATGVEKSIAIAARVVSDGLARHAARRPWDEAQLGDDPLAVSKQVLSDRWVKLTYADGAITMSDRIFGLMWVYDPGPHGEWNRSQAVSYCDGLSYAGHDDWALSRDLYGWSLIWVFADKHLFASTSGWSFWQAWREPVSAYYVNSAGALKSSSVDSLFHVWPVRSGQ